MVTSPGPVKHVLLKDIPEVDLSTRIAPQDITIRRGESSFLEEISFVDPEFFSIFDIETLEGDIEGYLGDSSSLVVSRSFAEKHFGDSNAVGETTTLIYNGFERDYKVVAVVENAPANSHLTWTAFAFVNENDFEGQPTVFDSWTSANLYNYFTLKAGTDVDLVRQQIENDFPKDHPLPDMNIREFMKCSIINIQDIQLHGYGIGEMKPRGDIQTVYIFSLISFLILSIAAVNFMNLATAKSTQRAREVSIRKVSGASRPQLIGQFLGESVLMALLGLLLALAFVELSLPWYNSFLKKELILNMLSGYTTPIFFGLAVFVGIAGGIYPAFYLSRFRPGRVLKSNRSSETLGSARLRHLLVIFQFTISTSLIITTGIIYGQLLYTKNLDLGFQHENIVMVRNLGMEAVAPFRTTLVQEISTIPGIDSVSITNRGPGDQDENNSSLTVPGAESQDEIMLSTQYTDDSFFKTYRIPLLVGRDFSRDHPKDWMPDDPKSIPEDQLVGSIILNELAIKRLGLGTPKEAVGRIVRKIVDQRENGDYVTMDLTVIGVVPTLHFDDLKRPMRPEMYLTNDWGYNNLAVRFSGITALEATSRIEAVWSQIVRDVPFLYEHVDEVLAEQYEKEASQATIFAIFSSLAVAVACLGLFGLAAFTVERRTKEIGIRKVMGAGVVDIVRLLVYQFSKPVILANIIAWPLSLYFMADWLQVFQYRIDLAVWGPILCLSAAAISLAIAWSTVVGHAVMVAKTNPIRALRYE